MDFKRFIMSKFGKDIFSIKEDDIVKERVKVEKEIEKISDDLKSIQEKIQKLMLEAKGQPNTLKMLNVQKIKALRLETRTKQMEASHYLAQLQLLLLVEAMKEREKEEKISKITEDILNSDIDKLNKVLMDTDVKEALKEGRLDLVKEKLERVFGREEMLVDEESQELIRAINDLEKVDEETALKMAGEKAKELSEESVKKEEKEEE
ncbi:MAG: hypothetical protein GTN76_12050 [Candidatus Aenigmarchaeota archaeon]|nr:hypothetical protein [Candidatus Aenigmarchaeota archaeon]